MAARKKRPILYEVFRPEPRSSDPALKPRAFRPSRAPERPVSTEEREPDLLTTTTFSSAPKPKATRDRRAITVSASTLTLLIAGMIVLLFVAFVAGRRYESFHPSAFTPAEFTLENTGETETPTDLAAGVDTPVSERMPTGSATTPDADENTARDDRSASGTPTQPPLVGLQRGCHYVIVQHFGRKSEDAEATARFLQERGVACAILRGRDIRVVATQPFLVSQPDAAAARRERQKANQLIEKIKRIGQEFREYRLARDEGSYTLDGAYLLEIK